MASAISARGISLEWRHNGRDCVSNHQSRECLLRCLIRRRSKKTSKLRVTGLCAGNSPGTGEFPAQRASNAENVSIWWRHHVKMRLTLLSASIHTTTNVSPSISQRPEHARFGLESFQWLCGLVSQQRKMKYDLLHRTSFKAKWLMEYILHKPLPGFDSNIRLYCPITILKYPSKRPYFTKPR